MKSLFLLGYKYIFCLPSRRSRQITVRALKIIYSFCSFACSSSSFTWQHVPDSSFSLVCILQHFVSSIDILHTLLAHVRRQYNYINHTCLRVLLKNNENYNYNFYTSLLIQVLHQPVTKFFPPLFNHPWSPQYYRSTYHYLLFSIYYYLLHSTRKFVPSNQKGFHPSR